MKDEHKTKTQLLKELAELRRRIAELEQSQAADEQAEEVLQTSETRYRRLFETAQDGIMILDANTGQVLDVNPFLLDLLGYAQEALVGKELWEIGLFRDIAASQAAFHELQDKSYIRYEDLPLETRDGRRIEVEFVSNVYLVNDEKVIQCNIRDITKHKQAEQALVVSETRYRRLFETAQDGIMILDANTGQVLDVNPFLLDLLGFSQEALLGKKLWEIGLFRDIAASQAAFLELQDKSYIRYEDLPLETHEGRRIEVEFVSNVYLVNDEKVIQCNIRDITARKRAEEASRHSESVYHALLEQASDGIFIADSTGQYVLVNEQACQMLGYTREELLQLTMRDLLTPEDATATPLRLDELRAGKTVLNERNLRRKDGSMVPVEISAKMLADGQLQGITRDITERKQADEALRQSEAQLRAILDHAPALISIKDLMGNVILVNRSFAVLEGPSPEEFQGKNIYDLFPYEVADALWRNDLAALEAQHAVEAEEVVAHNDGTWHTYLTIKFPLYRDTHQAFGICAISTDITERKRAGEEIESLAKFPAENPNPVLRLRHDGILLYANDASRTLLAEWGCAVGDYVPMFWRELVTETLANRSSRTVDIQYGDVTWSLSAEPFSDAGYINLYGSDITDRKQADEALRQSEARYRRLFEASQDGIMILDANTGQILDVNPFLLDLLGYAQEALVGKELWEIGLFQDIAESQAALLELQDNSYIRYKDLLLVTSQGQRIEVEFASNVYLVNDKKVIQCSVRDITGRRLTEAALRESEARFQRAIADAPFPMLIHAENGAIVVVNATWIEITGYTHADIPTIAAWTELAYGERKEMVRGDIDRLYSLEGRLAEGEYVITTRSGEKRIWDFSSSPVGRLSDGRRLVLSMAMDVTERRQAENEIRRLNAELEQRVLERTVQLNAVNHELEAFAYSVSHDLRAPLRALDGFSAALLSQYQGQLDEQGQHYLDRIQAASGRMGQLINDLLNLSRITRREMSRQEVDLSALAQEIADELHTSNPQREVEIVIADEMTVQGDAPLLRIVLENLMNNAWKFTGQQPQAHIEVGMTQQSGERVYFVHDNGAGFDMAYVNKLFAPFQRLHSMQEFPGTGIGLVTVQRIITRHGGRIWTEAAVNQGAAFYFTLGDTR